MNQAKKVMTVFYQLFREKQERRQERLIEFMNPVVFVFSDVRNEPGKESETCVPLDIQR